MMKKKQTSGFYMYQLVIQLFLEMLVTMGLGFFLGRWLDNILFENRQILAFVFLFLGIFIGLRNLIVRMLKLNKQEGEPDEK